MTSKRRKMNITEPIITRSLSKLSASNRSIDSALSISSNDLFKNSKTPLDEETPNLFNRSEIFRTDHFSSLLNRLNLMRNEETLCDYEIKCNEKTFHCHKFILIAMSDFFKTMLSSPMRESKVNYVELKGFSSANVFAMVLDYFYTGSLNITPENILNILEIASQLQINDILTICSDYLIKILTIQNCVIVLKLAETFCLRNVIELCTQYLCDNIIEIYQNAYDQFAQLSLEQLKYLLNSESLLGCSELDLFLMIVKWIEAEQQQRLEHAAELVRSVRFMCMSAEELADCVQPVDFMRNIPECNMYLMDAFRYYALPKRQPLITSEQCKLRTQEVLLAVGENSLYVLNEIKHKWETVCNAPFEENYRKDLYFGSFLFF